ncbi:MAG: mismatch-specific DNA-glycosylase [Clostridia bacterium]|nr:mismatch-specific DNA-glycosylase [Clostridia bacterium]
MDLLPDIIDHNLKVVFIGYNPGMKTAETGHHYAGPSNGFWKLLYESRLTPYRFKPEEDRKLLELGYGSTNIVSRPTKSASEIKKEEFREGSDRLKTLLQLYKPKIACYMGIGVYRMFTGTKVVNPGRQEKSEVSGIVDYVCSSPSGLNRMPYDQQLNCFKGLKKLIDSLDF